MSLLTDLEGRTDGLIALTGAGEGALTRLLAEGRRRRDALRDRLAERCSRDRLYVELARRSDGVRGQAREPR